VGELVAVIVFFVVGYFVFSDFDTISGGGLDMIFRLFIVFGAVFLVLSLFE